MDYDLIIKLFLGSWVLSSWAYTLVEDFDLNKIPKQKLVRFFSSVVLYVFSCPKCFSFWFSLMISQNFFIAAGVSFLVMLVDKITQNIKTKL
jgi:hypothetical protein